MTRLGDQHFGISANAVAQFAAFDGISVTAARTELESCLADAHQLESDPDRWRLRSRTTGLDLTLRTTFDRDRGHLVVTGISCRRIGLTRPAAGASVGRSAPAASLTAPGTSAAPAAAPLPPPGASAGADVRVVPVTMSAAEHLELVAELRGNESPAALLLASGLATARARARARSRR